MQITNNKFLINIFLIIIKKIFMYFYIIKNKNKNKIFSYIKLNSIKNYLNNKNKNIKKFFL